MIQDIFLYLRLIVYPLTVLGMAVALIMQPNSHKRKKWVFAMVMGIFVIIAIFAIELALLFNPPIHEAIKNVFLTPAIVASAIAVWVYVFRNANRNHNNHYKQDIR